MDLQASVRFISWTQLCFILLLSENVETKSAEIYTAPNNTVELIIPECTVVKEDTIVWKTGSILLAKWKDKALYYTECLNKACDLQENGVLTLQTPNRETTKYIVTVHSKEGEERCTREVTVMVQDMLDPPHLHLSCSSKLPSVTCSSASPTVSGLTLSWSGRSHNTSEQIIKRSINEPNVDVTCSARNHVSQRNTTITVSCPGGWSIYLMVSVGGGAFFLIVFIVLVVCVVKYKPWRRRRGDEELTRAQSSALRQLPQPPGPPHPTNGDFIEDLPLPMGPPRPEPQEPGARKKKQNRGRRPPPQTPGEAVYPILPPQAPGEAVYPIVPPQGSVPALPGNHPTQQAPRPHPRNMAKPPRQKHRQQDI